MRRSNPSAWWLMRLFAAPAGHRRFCLVYACFRWADDIVDAPGRAADHVRPFVERQRERVGDAVEPQEGLARRCLEIALSECPALGAAVSGMWDALSWDAHRGSEPHARAEIEAQIGRIGDAYARGLIASLECEATPAIFEAARAATGVHQVRDVWIDRDLGYCNVPAEDLAGIEWAKATGGDLAPWVKARCGAMIIALDHAAAGLGGVRPLRAWVVLRLYIWKYRRLALALMGPA